MKKLALLGVLAALFASGAAEAHSEHWWRVYCSARPFDPQCARFYPGRGPGWGHPGFPGRGPGWGHPGHGGPGWGGGHHGGPGHGGPGWGGGHGGPGWGGGHHGGHGGWHR